MTQSDYVLTSAPDVHAIAEQGRRLALMLAARDIHTAVRAALFTFWEAQREGTFNDYDRDQMNAIVSSHMHEARLHLATACQSDRFEKERYGWVSRTAGTETIPAMVYITQQSWESTVRRLMQSYEDCESGAMLESLTRFYEATDPALPDDYARMLLDA